VVNRGGGPMGAVGGACLVPGTDAARADERDATAGEIFFAPLARAEADAGFTRFLETPVVGLGDGIYPNLAYGNRRCQRKDEKKGHDRAFAERDRVRDRRSRLAKNERVVDNAESQSLGAFVRY
jgi:hypothetical protein